jgi:hypothetical protein
MTTNTLNATTQAMLQQIRDIDSRDEAQIMSELAGEALADYFYEIIRWDRKKKENVRIVRLSYLGVRETSRAKGNIILEEPIVAETDDHWRIMVRATDLSHNFSVFGGCHQPKKQKVLETDKNTGQVIGEHWEDDEYAFQKALSKAQRNALNSCIPEGYAARMIDKFLRLAGRPGLKQITQTAESKKSKKTENKAKTENKQPTKSQIKPREEWDRVTKESLENLGQLESLMWNLCKLQPPDMWKELGYSSKSDVNIPAWECFLQLKARFAPEAVFNDEETWPDLGGELETE